MPSMRAIDLKFLFDESLADTSPKCDIVPLKKILDP